MLDDMINEAPSIELSLSVHLCSDTFLDTMDSLLLVKNPESFIDPSLDLIGLNEYFLIVVIDI